MSMGQAKVTELADGRIDSVPQKPLNGFVKAQILAYLKRDDINIELVTHDMGANAWVVTDMDGEYVMSFENAWDYGYYYIEMANPAKKGQRIVVAEMDWYEADNNTNPQQQEIFDIFNEMRKRAEELKRLRANSVNLEEERKNLTPDEVSALKTLGVSEKTL
ncbi:MAG: hypothetical protein MJ165_00830 [Alphaproteobacteria bacterium]|nr:hypothetical protein [Alphaproteobacteria bacterium]